MRVFMCIVQEHDLWLVALAALVCTFGAWITMRLYVRIREVSAASRAAWTFLGAVAAGSTVWCTHFVAMLAYRPGVPVAYDAALTALSLAVAILAAALSLVVASSRFGFAREIGGGLFGLGIVAMHYTGMAAFGVQAFVVWDAAYVAGSVVLSIGIAACAFGCAGRMTGMWREYGAAGLLVLAIVSLHFTAMAAVAIVPFAPAAGALTVDDAQGALAVAVGGVGLLVIGVGLASYMLDRQAADRARARLRYLVDSAVDGMVVEQGGRIVEANVAFEALMATPREDLIGASFASLVDHLGPLPEGMLVQSGLRSRAGEPIPVEIVARREQNNPGEAAILVYAVRDLRQRLAQERRIAHLARNDSLTGLPNRASFLDRLERTVASLPAGTSLALLAIDLDRFKEVNDLHGHAVGDHVLRILSERMRDQLGESEFLARLGGDEFVALKLVRDRTEAFDLASRLETQLFAPIPQDHTELVCGASIGIALYPQDADSTTELLNNADLAMYRAKSSTALAVCFYEEAMDEVVRGRRKTMKELRDALARNQFELRYQAQASVLTGEITAYEVLLRWNHPERGYIEPVDFISMAEETGLIIPIGEWVLRTACAHAATWDNPYKIAVNLSAVQVGQIDLPRIVHQTLLETGLSPSRLELEITETALILDPERTTHILRQIKGLGVSVAMDDFGVGYSSLSTLRAFPFDKIKLDRSFMSELERSPQARAIIRAVLALGDSLGIPVLAEGVETAQQLSFLREEGCDEVQGYYLGRPSESIEPLSQPMKPPNRRVRSRAG